MQDKFKKISQQEKNTDGLKEKNNINYSWNFRETEWNTRKNAERIENKCLASQ